MRRLANASAWSTGWWPTTPWPRTPSPWRDDSRPAGPRRALAHIKDNLDAVPDQDFLAALDGEAERLVLAAGTADHTEAVRAFIDKREPVFANE